MKTRKSLMKQDKNENDGRFTQNKVVLEILLDIRDLLNNQDSKLYQIGKDMKRLRLHNENYFQIEEKVETEEFSEREEKLIQEAFVTGRIYANKGEKEQPSDIQDKLFENCKKAVKLENKETEQD